MLSFKDKVVLITGASSGIGEALSREYGRRGAHLVLVARREERLKTLASELANQGVNTIQMVVDVCKDGDMERAVELAIKHLGRLDVVVANAGFGVAGSLEKLTLPDFRRQFETNVFGVLRTLYSTLGELKKTRGRYVLIGSVMGYLALPEGGPYAMSKFAVRALSGALSHELRPYGISVTHICPGFVESQIRQVDNLGKWHPRAKDPIPVWLTMSSPNAARKIVIASYWRRREVVITLHGKLGVWVQRHFPWAIYLAMLILGIRGRKPAD